MVNNLMLGQAMVAFAEGLVLGQALEITQENAGRFIGGRGRRLSFP